MDLNAIRRASIKSNRTPPDTIAVAQCRCQRLPDGRVMAARSLQVRVTALSLCRPSDRVDCLASLHSDDSDPAAPLPIRSS